MKLSFLGLSLIISLAIIPVAGNAALPSQASDSLSLLENAKILNEEFLNLETSELQRTALQLQSIGYYVDVNSALRNKNAELLTKNAENICAIDSSTRLMNFQNVTLYRGHNYLGSAGTTIGGIVSDRAFSSTSLSEDTALRFASKLSPHILDVIEPSQQPVIGVWMGKVTMIANEYEVLLARNSQFEITAVEKQNTEKGELIIRHLRVIDSFETLDVDQILDCQNLN